MIVTLVAVDTARVVTVKVAVECPAPTVTVAGTLPTAGLLLVSETLAPPLGAGPLKVTVPVEPWPPTTAVGVRVNEVRLADELLPVCTLYRYEYPIPLCPAIDVPK